MGTQINRDFHKNLASFYATKPVYLDEPIQNKINLRKIVEQPWQLIQSNQWLNLVNLLKEENFIEVLWNQDSNSVFKYWASIEEKSKYKIIDEYNTISKEDNFENYGWYSYIIAEILYQFGHIDKADDLFGIFINKSILTKFSIDSNKNQANNTFNKEWATFDFELLLKRANIKKDLGHYDDALKMYQMVEEFATKWNLRHILKKSLVNKSIILSTLNRINESNSSLERAEQLTRDDKDIYGLSYILINKATNYIHLNEISKGKTLLEEALKIKTEYNDEDGIQNVLGNLAGLYWKEGNLEKAIEYFRLKEKKCRELGNKQSLQVAIGNLALALKDQGKLNEALGLLNEQEQICKDINIPRGLAYAYCNKAIVLNLMGKYGDAFQIAMLSKQIIKDNNLVEMNTGINEGLIDEILKEITRNIISSKEFKNIFNNINEENISIEYQNKRKQATTLFLEGKYKESKHLLEELLENDFEIVDTRVHLAGIAIMLNNYDEASKLIEEAWNQQANIDSYILARIIWIQLCLKIIGVDINRKMDDNLRQLNKLFQNESVVKEWTIQPVVEHLKSKMNNLAFEFLTTLIDVMTYKSPIEKINENENLMVNKYKFCVLQKYEFWRITNPLDEEYLKNYSDFEQDYIDSTIYIEAEKAFSNEKWDIAYDKYSQIIHKITKNKILIEYNLACCKVASSTSTYWESIKYYDLLIKYLYELDNKDEAINHINSFGQFFEFIKKEELARKKKENSKQFKLFSFLNSAKNEKSKQVLITEKFNSTRELSGYQFPSSDLLYDYNFGEAVVSDEELILYKDKIMEALRRNKINVTKISATIGNTLILYNIIFVPDMQLEKILGLKENIDLSLSILGVRIIYNINGKGTLGIEVPIQNPQKVSLKSILSSKKFIENESELPIALGKTIQNETYILDLSKMPNILVCGDFQQSTFGGLNVMIASLLYKKHPTELKFVFITSEKLEFNHFAMLEKHYLAKLPNEVEPVIADQKKAKCMFDSLIVEIDSRNELLSKAHTYNIKEYNEMLIAGNSTEEAGHRVMPYIVIVIDNISLGNDVELLISRIAMLGQIVGIHMIISTNQLSPDVITDMIKINFPTRITFKLESLVDSQAIINAPDANHLVGNDRDMLVFFENALTRIQCAFIDTTELENLCRFISIQKGFQKAFLLPDVRDMKKNSLN